MLDTIPAQLGTCNEEEDLCISVHGACIVRLPLGSLLQGVEADGKQQVRISSWVARFPHFRGGIVSWRKRALSPGAVPFIKKKKGAVSGPKGPLVHISVVSSFPPPTPPTQVQMSRQTE